MLQSIAIILVAFALAGCATADHSNRESLPRRTLAKDGLDRGSRKTAWVRRTLVIKKRADAAASTPDDDTLLAAIPKYSKEWVALYEGMRARDDAQLARALIICRGCFPLADGDGTWPIK
jgi:hypothetical protein